MKFTDGFWLMRLGCVRHAAAQAYEVRLEADQLVVFAPTRPIHHLSVFHFDCFWMREFQWCDFSWDDRYFSDPKGMLQRLKERGVRICVWINPYIAQKSPLFDEGAKHGYLLKKPDGSVWQTDMWQAEMGIVDFTNPNARRWFAEKLQAFIEVQVQGEGQWRLQLRNIPSVYSVEGGTVVLDSQGVVIVPEEKAERLVILLGS